MVKKASNLFVCNECGNEFSKWSGQCSGCGAWNSLREVPSSLRPTSGRGGRSGGRGVAVVKSVKDVVAVRYSRLSTGIDELDRVLGGDASGKGMVGGSMILLAGEPGIGKSTLLAQVCLAVQKGKNREGAKSVLYVSGEESVEQVGMRLQRLSTKYGDEKSFSGISLMSTNDVLMVAELIETNDYDLVIVDSIQTMVNSETAGTAGSVVQVREAVAVLTQVVKQKGVSLVLVGHVTKEGNIAGPRLLEHMVDVVLWFEGDRQGGLRIVRGIKNRYGSTNEVGVFTMEGEGLREVTNPSELFMEEANKGIPGAVNTVVMEGKRPFVIEIQALVVKTSLPMPRRVASGFDYNRLQTLLAVLTRRLRLRLDESDVYVNVVGGLKVTEPAVDAAVCAAVVSAMKDVPLSDNTIVVGEVGLLGELRKVQDLDRRVGEAIRLGYGRVVGPVWVRQIEGLVGVKSLREVISSVGL